MTAVVWLVAELLFREAVANAIGVVTAVVIVGFWFALPVSRRFSDEG